MKKLVLLLLLCFFLTGVAFSASEGPSAENISRAEISKKQSVEIALKDAGLEPSQVGFLSSVIEYSNETLFYRVGFFYNNTEYAYSVDAISGKVISKQTDYKYYPSIPVSKPSSNSNKGAFTITKQTLNQRVEKTTTVKSSEGSQRPTGGENKTSQNK